MARVDNVLAMDEDNRVRHTGHLLVSEDSDFTAMVNDVVCIDRRLSWWQRHRIGSWNRYMGKISTV